MTPLPLEVQHHIGESVEADLSMRLRPGVLADEVILTVNTAEVAVGKKDVSNTPAPGKERFFSKVLRACGNDRKIAGVTPGALVFQTIDPAPVWADNARTHQSFQRGDTPLQLAGFT